MKKLILFSLMAIAIQSQAQNVGIGTPTPAFAYKLHVHSDEANQDASIGITNTLTTDANLRGARLRMLNSDFFLQNYETTGKLGFYTNSNSRMTIASDGKVGIGVISPGSAALLEVDGQVKINGGSPGSGKVLVTDATGLAAWQNSTKYTSFEPRCKGLPIATIDYAKIGDLGTFDKDITETKIELNFQSFFTAEIFNGFTNSVHYELRIDDLPTTNGNARAVILYQNQDINASIFGLFTNLAVGSHTVSIWARARNSNIGTATNVYYDRGCFATTNLTVKETF